MKISVLTPSYNSVKYIERAIHSVLDQDYDNWEHVVVDAGSNDGTLDLLKKYSHLKYVSEPDKGQSDAMNKAFKMATGDIIVYLNADDQFEKKIFSLVIKSFGEDNCDMLVGNLVKVLPDGSQILDKPHIDLYKILNIQRCRFPLNPVSYFYRRKVQESIGLFPEDNNYTMDYWFLLRAIKRFKTTYTDRCFGYFYYMDNKSMDEKRAQHYLKIVRQDFLRENPITALKLFLKQEICIIK